MPSILNKGCNKDYTYVELITKTNSMFGTLQDTYVNVYELKWKEAQYKTTGDLTIYFCQTVIVKDS